ncbi:nuclear transport factor 2 family protein [Ottowia sp.]|uniref:nuclear transport factor 2 family protein n=1 Tax=Ottowia sp. TaxID=1898956 RepID=UPI002D1F9DF6|nr:nuclear transport factor 2 family protein [Ottowia sp.]
MKLDFDTWQALVQLQADYAAAVDSGDWELWPTFFTADCLYKLQPRQGRRRAGVGRDRLIF